MKDFRLNRRQMLAGSGAALGAWVLAATTPAEAATRLVYWHSLTSQSEFAGLKRVMEEFVKAYPGIAVDQENIPNPSFMAKFTTAVLSNARPDTVMVLAERIDDLVAMGGVLDIADRVNGWKNKGNFSKLAWDTITRDGKIYGTPAFTFVDWIYYRKDWFEEAGIDGPPKTFDEFRTAALKITDPAKGRYGFGLRGGAGGDVYITDMFTSYGALKVEGGKATLDRQAAIDALDFYTGLYTKDKVVPPSAPQDSYRQVMEGFRTGQTGMIWHHTGSLVEVSSDLKQGVQFMTAMVPAGPAAHYVRVSYAYNGLMSTANADAAWDWITFWGETAPEIAMLQETGYFPASSEAAKDPLIANNNIYAAAVETLKIGAPPQSFVGADDWRENAVMPATQSVLVGKSSVADAVDSMIKALEQNSQ